MFQRSKFLLKDSVARLSQKTTTGLVGVKVENSPADKLYTFYDRIIRAVQSLPQNSVYRQSTEALINHRWDIVKNAANVEEIEDKVNAGQIEELIIQAENELNLVGKMQELKPWEELQTKSNPDQWVYKYK